MTLKLQGLQLGNIGSGPVSLALDQLDDVNISSPVTGDFLRYNGVAGEWQNSSLNTDVFNYLSTNLLGTSNISITPLPGPNTITLGLVLDNADVVASLGYTPVNKAGDTMAGNLILNADPTDPFGAATKHYVDNVAAGLTVHPSCVTATSSPLTATYNNGSSGAGATLTGVGALPLISSYAPQIGDRILVKDQGNPVQNGIYDVTTLTPNWILTRSEDFDGSPTSDITAGDLVFIQEGSLGGTQWVQVTSGVINVGTSPIVFEQFAGPGTYSGGLGINVTGTIISNTGVTYLQGTAGEIEVSANTGTVTVGLPADVTGLNTVTAVSFIGNASSATILQTGRTISATGDATGTSASFNGSAAVSIPLTLATVNSSPQTDTFRKITVNSKGLVTATSAVTTSDITALVDGTYVNVTGDTMTGALALSLTGDSAQGISLTNTTAGTSAQSRISINNDLADSLSIGVNSSTFTGSGSGTARDSFIRSGLTSTGLYLNAQAGSLRIATGSTERLRFDSTGAWGLAGANYGSSGQVLASNGPGTPPTWQNASTIVSSDYVAKTGDTMTGNLGIGAASDGSRLYVSGVTRTTGSAFIKAAASYSSFASALTVDYSGAGAEYGLTLKPASTTTNTNAISFLTSTSTPASAATVGVIQQLASDGGMRLTGNWDLNGNTFITSANISSQTVSSANTLTTSRTISATGDATWSVNFDGSANVSSALTLATVNSNVGTFSYPTLTVNAKGLITAVSSNQLYYTFTNGVNSPGPTTFNSNTIAGFDAFNSSDFPGSYWTGLQAIGPSGVRSFQIAANWNSEEAAPSGLIFRTNDDTGTTANWSPWTTIWNSQNLVNVSQLVNNVGYITGNQTITLSGDVSGSGTTSISTTLATVNASPQTDAFRKVTVNAKGLVTATSAVTAGDITALVDGAYVNVGGDTMTGLLTNTAPETFRVQNTNGFISGYNSAGSVRTGYLQFNSGSVVQLTGEGSVGVFLNTNGGSMTLAASGNASFTNQVTAPSFNATSTIDVKEKVEDLSSSYVERFNQLRPREYDRTDYHAHEFGFIAEEMQEIYPEIVGKDETGKPTGIDYGKLSTILTAKVLEQQKQIDTLMAMVNKLIGDSGV